MMTSMEINIFRVTGPFEGISPVTRDFSSERASDAELWCFLWSAPEQTIEQNIETLVNWDTIAPIMTSP